MDIKADEISVLLIDNNTADANLIKEMLNNKLGLIFKIDHKKYLQDALKLKEFNYDIVLLDIGLADLDNMTLIDILQEDYNIQAPIIILTDFQDEEFAIKVVRAGVQDYIVKGEMSASRLAQAIKYAIERHKILKEVKKNSLLDELTGLYNRKGFFNLAEQEVKRALRLKNDFLLFYTDIDRLKRINDLYGHFEGDKVIKDIAEMLRNTFRQSDIICRIGGDEFVVLALDSSLDSIKAVRKRMENSLVKYNNENNKPYNIFVSMGVTVFSAENPLTITELINQADRKMYETKVNNKNDFKNYILSNEI
ncbi:MAG: GGDEF domain-containing protein [Bacillota bacterium]